MIPGTLAGLLVFAASIGPGYVWVRIEEKRRPRPERTPLLEAAELFFVGATASTVAFLTVLVAGDRLDVLDPDRLAQDGVSYLLREPERGLGSVALALLLAYGGTAIVARIRFRNQLPTIQLGGSAWHTILNPSGSVSTPRDPRIDRLAYITVGLKSGIAVAGWPYVYTVEPSQSVDRELVLANPIHVRAADASDFVPIKDQLVYLNGADIVSISASYYRVPPEPPAPRFRRLRDWRTRRQHGKQARDVLASLDD